MDEEDEKKKSLFRSAKKLTGRSMANAIADSEGSIIDLEE
jgi:hypothetical protein